MEGFLHLLARYPQIGSSLVEVALRAGEGQALANELLAGGGEMGVGFRCCGKRRILVCFVHPSHSPEARHDVNKLRCVKTG